MARKNIRRSSATWTPFVGCLFVGQISESPGMFQPCLWTSPFSTLHAIRTLPPLILFYFIAHIYLFLKFDHFIVFEIWTITSVACRLLVFIHSYTRTFWLLFIHDHGYLVRFFQFPRYYSIILVCYPLSS